MILYLDSSSVISWHLQEPGRQEAVGSAIEDADFAASSLLAYAEIEAVFARARRDRRLTEQRYNRLRSEFERDWRTYIKVQVGAKLVRQAADLAGKHALRGYDAVRLASALALRNRVPDTVSFSAWDERLARAAASEGFQRAH